MTIGNSNGLQTSSLTPSGDAGLMINNNFKRLEYLINPKNYLINGGFNFAQRQLPTAATSFADDAYGPDRWYHLSQTASTQYTRVAGTDGTDISPLSPFIGRLTQNQVAAQRHGIAQIVENHYCAELRSTSVRFQIQVRSSNSTTIRYAILEWTGTADTVTSDWVLDWTNGTFTAGQFFTTTSTTVAGTGSTAVTANAWSTVSVEAAVSASMNNIAVMVWTDSTQAQNSTLDLGQAMLVRIPSVGLAGNLIWQSPEPNEEFKRCQRYFQTNTRFDEAPADNATFNESYIGNQLDATNVYADIKFPVRIRSNNPTMTYYRSSNSSSNGQWGYYNGGYSNGSGTTAGTAISEQGMRVGQTTTSLTTGHSRLVKGMYTASAEL